MARSGSVPVLRLVLALVLALVLLQAVLYGRLLAPLVAIWFGLDGRALIWAARGWLLAAAVVPAILIGALAFAALPRLARRPGGPERERLGLWFGIVSAAFLAVLTQLVFDANAATLPVVAMHELLWLATSYVLFVALWAWMLRRAVR